VVSRKKRLLLLVPGNLMFLDSDDTVMVLCLRAWFVFHVECEEFKFSWIGAYRRELAENTSSHEFT